MNRKFLLGALLFFVLMGLKVNGQPPQGEFPYIKPGVSIQDRFEDQEITEIIFGKNLERDEPFYSLEDRCPTPPTPEEK